MNDGSSFRLVTLDLDGTMFMGNSVFYVNRLGLSEELVEQHSKYGREEITEAELNYLQLPILQSVDLSSILKALAEGPLLKNIERGRDHLRKYGLGVAMLSFNPLQLLFERKFGIDCDICKTVEVAEDRISKINKIRENKIDYLRDYCRASGMDLKQCIHVGDGPNDIPSFREVGFSVALNSKDRKTREAARIALDTDDFEVVARTIVEKVGLSGPSLS